MKMKIYEAKNPLNIVMRGIDSVENLGEKFIFKELLWRQLVFKEGKFEFCCQLFKFLKKKILLRLNLIKAGFEKIKFKFKVAMKILKTNYCIMSANSKYFLINVSQKLNKISTEKRKEFLHFIPYLEAFFHYCFC